MPPQEAMPLPYRPFPADFPEAFRAPVVQAHAEAERTFRSARAGTSGLQRQKQIACDYFLAVVLAFARHACDAVRAKAWPLSQGQPALESVARREAWQAFRHLELEGLWLIWPAFHREAMQVLHNSTDWHDHLTELSALTAAPVAEPEVGAPIQAKATALASWADVKIRVLSDHAVQVTINDCPKPPQNYAEIGFEDRRTQKPNRAWQMLLELAASDGVVDRARRGRPWPKVEKDVQELRKRLRALFGISDDPLPFKRGRGYRAAFGIQRLPSLEKPELL